MTGVERENLPVERAGIGDLAAFLATHRFQKKVVGPDFTLRRAHADQADGRRCAVCACVEIEDELAGNRLHGRAGVTEDEPGASTRRACLKQRVGHARY
jgi:hypothetical protein